MSQTKLFTLNETFNTANCITTANNKLWCWGS